MFNKVEEKAKVGRPKLADDVRKKDSLISIAICTVMALVLFGGGVCNIVGVTPLQLLKMNNNNKLVATVAEPVTVKRVIPANVSVTKKITSKSNVRVIPAIKANVIKIK